MPRIKRQKILTDRYGLIAARLVLSERLSLTITAHSKRPSGVMLGLHPPIGDSSRSALSAHLTMTDEEAREMFAVIGQVLRLKREGMKRTPRRASSPKPKRRA